MNQPRHTLPELLRTAASRANAGVIWDGRPISYAALEDEARRVAGGLSRLGVGPGDRVALWLPNGPAWLTLLFACARLGAIMVAINTRFRRAEASDLLNRSGAKLVAVQPGYRDIDFLEIIREIEPEALAAMTHIVTCGDGGSRSDARGAPRDVIPYDDLARSAPMSGDASSPDAGCAIFTTSGTTRAPKLVLHRQEGLVRHAHDAARAFGYDARDARILQVLPLCGVFGFCQAMAGIAAAASIVLVADFDAKAVGDAIREHAVTHVNGTDDMFRKLLDARLEDKPFPSLRLCGFAAFTGDPEELVARGDARGMPFIGLYGMSEVQALFAAQPASASSGQRALAGGIPVSLQARVRARDPETHKLLPDGEPGELEIAGPSLMAEYWGNPDASRAAMTDDGFFRTGDLGYTERNGFVFLSRLGDALRLSGFLVSPEEISSHVEQLDGVAACQVVGVRTEAGLKPVAFVIRTPGEQVSEAEILDHCRAGLAHFKHPARILFVDAFPVTESANGVKIQRTKLRELAERDLRPNAP